MRKLSCVIFFLLFFATAKSGGVNFHPFKCYSICVANCGTSGNADFCDRSCSKFNQSDFCDTESCWEQCGNGNSHRPVEFGAPPQDLKIQKHEPRNIVLTWDKSDSSHLGYLLQFRTNMFENWTTVSEIIHSPPNLDQSNVSFTFAKNGLCLKYQFRLAAIRDNFLSDFSAPISTDFVKPDTTSESVRLNILSAEEMGANHIKVAVKFQIPPGWTLFEELTPVIEFLPINCPSGPTPKRTFEKSQTVMFFEISNCSGSVIFAGLKTKCGETVQVRPNVVAPVYFDATDCSLYKAASFCDRKTGRPLCTRTHDCTSEFNFTHRPHDLDCKKNLTKVPIVWDPNFVPKVSLYCEPKGYFIRWGRGFTKDKEATHQILGDMAMQMEEEGRDANVRLEEGSYQISGVNLGQKLVVQTCIFYGQPDQAQLNNDLQISRRQVLNLDYRTHCGLPVPVKRSKWTLPLIIGLPIACVLAFVATSAYCIYKKTQKDRKRIENMEIYLAEQRYTDVPLKPEVADIWELDRRLLLVYEEEPLGKGAFGKVFRGKVFGRTITDPKSKSLVTPTREDAVDMPVAVKQCYEFADEGTKRDFLQEIELMKKLYYHPRLVNILQCITASEPYSLIVEYCPLGDLLQYLRSRRKYMVQLAESDIDVENLQEGDEVDFSQLINFKTVLQMSFQICDGMEYISDKGYLHRDLAARNILVSAADSVKIGDFGLTRFVQGSSNYIAKGGKLPIKWMALEAIENFEFSSKSDVWSFGILLFEILTLGGVPYPDVMPVDGDFRREMLTYLRDGNRMGKPDNCTPELYDIMWSTWLKDPEHRPGFAKTKEILRKMVEALANEDCSGDMYIDPSRSYYNCLDPFDQSDLEPDRITLEDDGEDGSVPVFELGPVTPAEPSLKAEKRPVVRQRDSGLGDENSLSLRSYSSTDIILHDTSPSQANAQMEDNVNSPSAYTNRVFKF